MTPPGVISAYPFQSFPRGSHEMGESFEPVTPGALFEKSRNSSVE